MTTEFRAFVILASILVCNPTTSRSEDSAPAGPPLLVILTETGEERDGLPVYALHPDPGEAESQLSRGLCGVLLRVYRLEQRYLQRAEGTQPEPLYVLLSDHQGGYAREGFFLGDEEKRSTAYVDVYREWPLSGHFGAIDQLVPHELAHAMRRQLAGELIDGGTNQVHAIGVRTDRVVAFNEGFAEHFQVMAIEHPDAVASTRALAGDRASMERVERHLKAYRRELTARFAVAPRMRMGFLAWFSNGEDVLRYHAVKSNAFAREAEIPETLLNGRGAYRAYLLENTSPGSPTDVRKSIGRLVSTEGVIATLFTRWANDALLAGTYRDEDFYRQFDVTAAGVSPLENVYLKLLDVLYVAKPQTVIELVAAYRDHFPDEGERVDALVEEVFGVPTLAVANEIWLANPAFPTGTTLFDQYRGLPRAHTFDLNAASMVDLVGVPGVDLALAEIILASGPYADVEQLRAVDGVDASLLERLEGMQAEMAALRAAEEVDTLSIRSIVRPFLWRAFTVLGVSALLAGALIHGVRRGDEHSKLSRKRIATNALGASLVGCMAGWAFGLQGLASVAGVLAVFGLPATLWCLGRRRAPGLALRVLAAWVAAALPAAILTSPWA